jgi:hypothetical protein
MRRKQGNKRRWRFREMLYRSQWLKQGAAPAAPEKPHIDVSASSSDPVFLKPDGGRAMKKLTVAILLGLSVAGCATPYGYVQTPQQRECSQQADALDLHGHERRIFRQKCLGRL